MKATLPILGLFLSTMSVEPARAQAGPQGSASLSFTRLLTPQ